MNVRLALMKNKLIDRFVRSLNNKGGATKKIKGANCRRGRAAKISRKMIGLFRRNVDVVIICMAIDKRMVSSVIKEKGNDDEFNNYVVRKGIIERLRALKSVRTVPDQRSISHVSQIYH